MMLQLVAWSIIEMSMYFFFKETYKIKVFLCTSYTSINEACHERFVQAAVRGALLPLAAAFAFAFCFGFAASSDGSAFCLGSV